MLMLLLKSHNINISQYKQANINAITLLQLIEIPSTKGVNMILFELLHNNFLICGGPYIVHA